VVSIYLYLPQRPFLLKVLIIINLTLIFRIIKETSSSQAHRWLASWPRRTVSGCFTALSTTSDRQLRADGHVPVISGRSGNIQTRLRKWRADRSSEFRHTWFANPSRCRTQLHGWSSNFDASITLQMHWSSYTGCASWSESSTRSPYWRSRCCMESHWSNSDLLFLSLTCLIVVDRLITLLVLTAWWCHRSYCQQSALVLSRWPVLTLGIVCLQT